MRYGEAFATRKSAHAHAAVRTAGMHVLMVCALFALPYRVMQCIAATGAVVHVLGGPGSAGLRFSRHCHRFVLYRGVIGGQRDATLASEINKCIRQFGIEMVVPAGPLPTRALIASRDMVDSPCFPLPSLAQFDLLNDKWRFINLCRDRGIPCPSSRLFADRTDLRASLERGLLKLPAMAKPLSRDGGHGVLQLDAADAASQISRIDYSPVVVQDYIEGEDIGASVYCEGGAVRSFIANSFRRGTYTTIADPAIRDAFCRILGPLGVDGVYHFDIRRSPDGRLYYLECNPRFYFKIALSMMAGINFVQLGLDPAAPVPCSVESEIRVKRPWAAVASLSRPWTVTVRDLRQLWQDLKDPIPLIRESLRIDWDR